MCRIYFHVQTVFFLTPESDDPETPWAGKARAALAGSPCSTCTNLNVQGQPAALVKKTVLPLLQVHSMMFEAAKGPLTPFLQDSEVNEMK